MIYDLMRLTKSGAVDLLASLKDAREQAVPWHTLALRLRRLEDSAPLAPDGQPWIRAVEAASGYSANHLRRMAKAFSLVDAMQQRWPGHSGLLATLSFTHAEILGRLWETDPSQVEQLLKAERWPSYAQLLAQYEHSRSRRSAPKAAGKLALGNFRTRVRTFLQRQFGPALRDRVPHHPYVKPDFLVVLPRRQVLAWDCVLLPEKLDEEALHRRFVAWATESTFVTEFWIVVQNDHGMDLMRRCVADLVLANVGVMAWGGASPVIHPHGPPVPDRRTAVSTIAFDIAPRSPVRGRS
jgi:hypothetical protein